jgi:hypothetical protein
MNWNDLKTAWSSQDLPAGPGADLASLQSSFETKRRKLARALFRRDIVEASAGLFVAGVFAHTGWKMGWAGWPIALAVILMLGLTGFFIRERLRARRQRLGADAPLLAKLEADIAELRHQRRLLLNVGKWYLAPCFVAAAVFAGTAIVHAPVVLSAKLLTSAIMLVVLALTYWGVWSLNRRAVWKQIEPRLRELEDLHQSLLNSKE